VQNFGLTKQRLDCNVFANLVGVLVLLGLEKLGIDLEVICGLFGDGCLDLSFSLDLFILREGTCRDSVFGRELPAIQGLSSNFSLAFGS
jgi:hypothetical protein